MQIQRIVTVPIIVKPNSDELRQIAAKAANYANAALSKLYLESHQGYNEWE